MEIVLSLLVIAGMWKIFEKAGKPGWAAIVPIYNIYILLQIIRKPVWWIAFVIVPYVFFILSIVLDPFTYLSLVAPMLGYMMIINLIAGVGYSVMMFFLSKTFGQSIGYTIGIILLPFIFIPLLGFGKHEKYQPDGPVQEPVAPTPDTPQHSSPPQDH